LALLLFVQWPLREWVQAYSRQANDMGQILFALYVAVAITAASVALAHLAAGVASPTQPSKHSPWRAWALLICLGPWAVFMLWSSFAPLRESMLGLERFAETLTPGFYVVKLALALMLLLVLWDAVRGVVSWFKEKP
jgi:hypothetical protein